MGPGWSLVNWVAMEGSGYRWEGKGKRHGVPGSRRKADYFAPAREANPRAVRAITMAGSERAILV